MLAIRLQRRGRHGHAQFRLVVQDSRFSPKSGRVVAYLGSYNPHTKSASIDGDKTASYLANGAQPSDRAARVIKAEGVKLPSWVKMSEPKKRQIRHPDKLRRNRPPEEKAAEPAAAESQPEAEEAKVDGEEPEAQPVKDEAIEAESEVEVKKETAEASNKESAEPEKTA